MNIEIKNSSVKKFKDIKQGEVFVFGEQPCMRIENLNGVSGWTYTAVGLTTGTMYRISPDSEVLHKIPLKQTSTWEI